MRAIPRNPDPRSQGDDGNDKSHVGIAHLTVRSEGRGGNQSPSHGSAEDRVHFARENGLLDQLIDRVLRPYGLHACTENEPCSMNGLYRLLPALDGDARHRPLSKANGMIHP